MSLINQMLQDLEKRRASGTERSALPDQVRVLPREETHSMPWWLLGIGIAVMLIGVSAWQFNRGSASSVQSIAQTPEQPDLLQAAPLSGASAPRPGPERPQSPPSLAPAPAKQSSSTARAVSSADVLTPRKATSGESLKAAPREKLLPTPVAKASVLAGADPATAKPSAVVLNAEIAKSPFFLSPADAPKLSSTSPPAIAPLAPAGRPCRTSW